jgi:hypothetical protein
MNGVVDFDGGNEGGFIIRENINHTVDVIVKTYFLISELQDVIEDIQLVIKKVCFDIMFYKVEVLEWSSLCDLLSDISISTSCTNVRYKNKDYYERSSIDRHRSDLYDFDNFSDEDHICTSENGICDVPPSVYPEPHEITYTIWYEHDFKECRPHQVLYTFDEKVITLVSTDYDSNNTCMNHCDIYLHQHLDRTIRFPITMHDLASHYMRIRPHKFMFNGRPICKKTKHKNVYEISYY